MSKPKAPRAGGGQSVRAETPISRLRSSLGRNKVGGMAGAIPKQNVNPNTPIGRLRNSLNRAPYSDRQPVSGRGGTVLTVPDVTVAANNERINRRNNRRGATMLTGGRGVASDATIGMAVLLG